MSDENRVNSDVVDKLNDYVDKNPVEEDSESNIEITKNSTHLHSTHEDDEVNVLQENVDEELLPKREETGIEKDSLLENEKNNTIVLEEQDNSKDIESVQDKQETDSKLPFKLTLDDDSFIVHPLIEHIPDELEYTCFESYEQNLYLGTESGDLLHYFEIEKSNYMLVSQTKFNSEFNKPIDKIILLPNIERALLLSNNTLTQFLLPEFAPAPNTENIANISYLLLKSYSTNSNSYKILLFLENEVNEYRITQTSTNLVRRYPWKSISEASLCDKSMMIARSNHYELIQARSKEVTPLFKVSESDEPLKPIISSNNGTGFNVVTGGTSIDSTAMVFKVNKSGEIDSGNLVLDRYPDSVLSKSPYLIVNFNNNEIHIYKEVTNGDSALIQIIKSQSKFNICESFKQFECSNIEEAKKIKSLVTEKLRLVPLEEDNGDIFRINGENSYINSLFKLSTSMLLYGKAGIYLLIQKPGILRFDKYDEKEIENVRGYIGSLRGDLTKYQQIEKEYLTALKILLYTLHNAAIDEKIISKWYQVAELVDIRLLLYLLDMEYYGNLCIFNGLKKFIENLKLLKLIHKVKDKISLITLLNRKLINCSKREEIRDYNNVMKSIEMNLFHLLTENNKEITTDMFIEPILNEILLILQEEPEKYSVLLKKIYLEKHNYTELITLFKNEGNAQEILDLIVTKFSELPKAYTANELIEDLIYIINSLPLNNEIIKKTLSVVEKANFNINDFTDKLTSNVEVKVAVIEHIGAKSEVNKEFLLRYYLANFQKELELNNLWENLGKYASEYTSDLNYYKSSLSDFLLIKLKYDSIFNDFLNYIQQIKLLCKDETVDNSNIRLVLDDIKKIDIGNLLLMLFLMPEFIGISDILISSDELLSMYMLYNDFLNIERYLKVETFLKVFNHYLSFSGTPDGVKTVITFLKRNCNTIVDNNMLVKIFELLPDNFSVMSLFDVLFPIIKKREGIKHKYYLEKALARNELTSYSNTLNHFKCQE
ncbi:hypothetical protein TPHA_0P01080 [Tetrapisispora phaffii CBS 4417]|uniref:CNH domain-containing protein n=1 Tax=Tetrapisispora phaffii (strain ATCC 24235 / CBS 4417 / NBRC 1672 / NRRL Y-8282 / UCD 70-5) TaxID=1071381 RepID=G8C288_TETPH|nr:hypothetical protein TPHA_0P01080 [Tetrapisispora phaffii CBS 4417]CCE66266.1 hypothetical protein TPHA_0P01080 [Tetrapisispora phaffii CBS 4417]